MVPRRCCSAWLFVSLMSLAAALACGTALGADRAVQTVPAEPPAGPFYVRLPTFDGLMLFELRGRELRMAKTAKELAAAPPMDMGAAFRAWKEVKTGRVTAYYHVRLPISERSKSTHVGLLEDRLSFTLSRDSTKTTLFVSRMSVYADAVDAAVEWRYGGGLFDARTARCVPSDTPQNAPVAPVAALERLALQVLPEFDPKTRKLDVWVGLVDQSGQSVSVSRQTKVLDEKPKLPVAENVAQVTVKDEAGNTVASAKVTLAMISSGKLTGFQ